MTDFHHAILEGIPSFYLNIRASTRLFPTPRFAKTS